MGMPARRPTEVFQVPRATLWITVFVALLLQTFLPLKVPIARMVDFPLLVTIYFALVRRNKLFGIALGTALGLMQDALSHRLIGMYGMAKALVGYLAAWVSVKVDLEETAARFVVTGVLTVLHELFYLALQHLPESAPPFRPASLVSSILINVALALILFQVLDRLKQSA